MFKVIHIVLETELVKVEYTQIERIAAIYI